LEKWRSNGITHVKFHENPIRLIIYHKTINLKFRFDLHFDATILKLYTQRAKLRGDFGEASEKLQEALKTKLANIDLIIRLLTDNYENFKISITENFGVSSEMLRKQGNNIVIIYCIQ